MKIRLIQMGPERTNAPNFYIHSRVFDIRNMVRFFYRFPNLYFQLFLDSERKDDGSFDRELVEGTFNYFNTLRTNLFVKDKEYQ